MEIKRRLNKVAKDLSPQIEAMNVSIEMSRMCDRFEELVRYAQEKIDRVAEQGGKSMGVVQAEKRAAADKVIKDHQTAEAEENLKDQQEAFDERNKGLEKSQKREYLVTANGAVPVLTEMEVDADNEAQASRDERGATKEEDQAALAEEVKPTKKKAKKKKRAR